MIPKDSRDDNYNRDARDKSVYQVARPGDLVINKMKAWQGSLAVSGLLGLVSADYEVMEFTRRDILPRFAHYLLRSAPYIAEYERLAYGVRPDQWRLMFADFRSIPMVAPPLHVQTAIVHLLDRRTAAIDALIEMKERLATLLEEQRQAFVTQAVTIGLDPTVPMKDSGDRCIGLVPLHWTVARVKHLVDLVTSGSRGWSEHFSDEGALFLQSGNLDRRLGLDLSETQRVTPPANAEGVRTAVRQSDVLVCITGALTGNVGLVVDPIDEAYVNQHLALLRPTRHVAPGFLAAALGSRVGTVQFDLLQYGGTKAGLGLDDVRSVVLAVPPLEEQYRIASAVRDAIARAKGTVESLRRQMLMLREYRQALITAAVTGKLDLSKEAC